MIPPFKSGQIISSDSGCFLWPSNDHDVDAIPEVYTPGELVLVTDVLHSLAMDSDEWQVTMLIHGQLCYLIDHSERWHKQWKVAVQ